MVCSRFEFAFPFPFAEVELTLLAARAESSIFFFNFEKLCVLNFFEEVADKWADTVLLVCTEIISLLMLLSFAMSSWNLRASRE